MRFKDTKVRSLTDYLENLKARPKTLTQVWYRGQSVAKWGLQPTIARMKGGISTESALITRFKQNALSLLDQRPASEWEWLFIMRHHGVPTRLMDWTESALVALYFAAEHHPRSDGAVWCMLPIELNKQANIRPQHPTEIPGFGDNLYLENYLPSKLIQEQSSNLLPAAAIAPRNTPRMQAQHGVFTITHREQKCLTKVGMQEHVWRITVPAGSKKRILSDLSAFNVTRLSLFPELDHVAAHAKELLS